MQVWQITQREMLWTGQGNQALLDKPLTAFFSSRQCPGAAIRAAMDWALEQARRRQPVVSGFHSPLEQSVLKVLLQARCPVVAVLARPVAGARLPPEWAEPLAQERMTVVSAAASTTRLTGERAVERNQLAARLAIDIVVAHASPSGQLSACCDQWRLEGRMVVSLG